MLINAGLLACGIVGLLIASYFTLVYYNKMRPNQWFIPPVCRMEDQTCMYIIHTSDAKVFGAPNSLIGIVYYGGIMIFTILSPTHVSEILNRIVIGISLGTILLGGYLVYSLLFKLKTRCILCFTGHAINVIILILLLYRNN